MRSPLGGVDGDAGVVGVEVLARRHIPGQELHADLTGRVEVRTVYVDEASERPPGVDFDPLGQPAEIDGRARTRRQALAGCHFVDRLSGVVEGPRPVAGEHRRPCAAFMQRRGTLVAGREQLQGDRRRLVPPRWDAKRAAA